jgi:hypothetical protein
MHYNSVRENYGWGKTVLKFSHTFQLTELIAHQDSGGRRNADSCRLHRPPSIFLTGRPVVAVGALTGRNRRDCRGVLRYLYWPSVLVATKPNITACLLACMHALISFPSTVLFFFSRVY